MIADAVFGGSSDGARRWRFVPRASIPVAAACLVANGVREVLRDVLGERCELVVGEPVALSPDGWTSIARGALLFLTPGRQTDVMLVLQQGDARRLVLRALGDTGGPAEGACSALEREAAARIAARCAAAFDPLCAERLGPACPVSASAAAACTAYFDLRLIAPVAVTVGIGISRELPDPGPAGALGPSALAAAPVELRALLGRATLDAADIVKIRPGDVVKLDTKGGGAASLNIGSHRFAEGVCGVRAGRHAFFVQDLANGVP